MDLHSFDTKLDKYEIIHTTDPFKFWSKTSNDIKKLHEYYTLTPRAKQVLDVLINDMETNRNIDTINKINADDLLKDIYVLSKMYYTFYEDTLSQSGVFSEQLEEMLTGMCPQGRCIRLFQIFIVLKEQYLEI